MTARTSKPKRMNTDGPVSVTFMAQITTNVMSTAASSVMSVTRRMCERREMMSDCSICVTQNNSQFHV